MSKVYFPIRFIDVPASLPHGGNPAYRVSIGTEHWEDGVPPEAVYKIQMVYGGIVSGRKSPSYPEGSDDLDRVFEALQEIKKGGGKKGRGMIEAVGPEKGTPVTEMHATLEGLQ